MTRERRGAPCRVGDLTITPIEEITFSHGEFGGQLLIVGGKRPIAVVVTAPGREWRIELPRPES